jgi:hypothetical protein
VVAVVPVAVVAVVVPACSRPGEAVARERRKQSWLPPRVPWPVVLASSHQVVGAELG